MKDFDVKQFLLQHGEKIGIGVSLLIMILFVWWGLGRGSGPTSDEAIKKNAASARQAIQQSQVQEDKIHPQDAPTEDKIRHLETAFHTPIHSQGYQLLYPFAPRLSFEQTWRSNPEVFAPEEVVGIPMAFSFRVFEIEEGKEGTRRVYVVDESELKVKPAKSKTQKQENERLKRGGRQRGGYPGFPGPGMPSPGGGRGRMGGYPGYPGAGGGGEVPGMPGAGGGAGRRGGFPGDTGSPDEGAPGRGAGPGGIPPFPGGPAGTGGFEPEAPGITRGKWIDADKLQSSHIIAQNLRPEFGVLLVGSVPYKRQIEEVARAYKKDLSQVTNAYFGVEVQRREILRKNTRLPDGTLIPEDSILTPEGKLVPLNSKEATTQEIGWVDVRMGYVTFVMNRVPLEEFVEESDQSVRDLRDLAGRLVINLPRLARGEYPEYLDRLVKVRETLSKMREEGRKRIPKPPPDPRLPREGFDPFDPNLGLGAGTTQGEGSSTGTAPSEPASFDYPEYIFFRTLDIEPGALVPGATYQYRVRIVMVNENYGRSSEVSDPAFAYEELIYGAWSQPSEFVTVPRMVEVYTADKPEKGRLPEHQALLEIHKWVAFAERADDPNKMYPVGDWVVEKMPVARGDYIGRTHKTRLPVWISTMLNTTPGPNEGKIGADRLLELLTGALGTASILVDFQGGRDLVYRDRGGQTFREQSAPLEILYIDDQGKLRARSYINDRNDKDRRDRSERWDKWFKDVESREPGKDQKNGGKADFTR